MFIEKNSTEIVTIDKEIKVENAITPIVEYAVALNKIPDYITGCAVKEIKGIEESLNNKFNELGSVFGRIVAIHLRLG